MSGLWLILIMELLGHRGRRNKKTSGGTLFFLMCVFITTFPSSQEPQNKTCPEGDFLTEGICCHKCSQGFKLVEKCHAPGQRTNCTPCPEGQYTDQLNYSPNCRQCRICKASKYEIELSPCKREQNTICGCKKEYYQFKIDSVTYECRRCKKCRPDEVQKEPCTSNSNTVCGCKDDYYKVNNKCEPCKNCSPECSRFCSFSTTGTKHPEYPHEYLINVIAGAVTVVFVLLVLVGFVTYMATKQYTKKKLLQSSQQSNASQESCKVLVDSDENLESNNVKVVPQILVAEGEVSNLPDCVPLEIKIPDLIYTVLDVVPVLQVKQLVRCLGVTDTEIGQAEMDHRSCREAHYQMLRVWSERGSRSGGGGRGGMLHRPLLEELLEKLRMMHLGRAAEELETMYGIQ